MKKLIIIKYTQLLYYVHFFKNTVDVYNFGTKSFRQMDLDMFIATFQKDYFLQCRTTEHIAINKQQILHKIKKFVSLECYLKTRNLYDAQFVDNEYYFLHEADEYLCFD